MTKYFGNKGLASIALKKVQELNPEAFIEEKVVRADGKRGRPMKDGSTEMKTLFSINYGHRGRPVSKAKGDASKKEDITTENEIVLEEVNTF